MLPSVPIKMENDECENQENVMPMTQQPTTNAFPTTDEFTKMLVACGGNNASYQAVIKTEPVDVVVAQPLAESAQQNVSVDDVVVDNSPTTPAPSNTDQSVPSSSTTTTPPTAKKRKQKRADFQKRLEHLNNRLEGYEEEMNTIPEIPKKENGTEETQLAIARPFTPIKRPDGVFIHPGACFYTFAQLQIVLEEFKLRTLSPFRIASSEGLTMGTTDFDDVLRYKYVVYHCVCYGEPRKRGGGKRPNQTYLPSGCTAMIRVTYSPTEKCLKVTTMRNTHNHALTLPFYYEVDEKIQYDTLEETMEARDKKLEILTRMRERVIEYTDYKWEKEVEERKQLGEQLTASRERMRNQNRGKGSGRKVAKKTEEKESEDEHEEHDTTDDTTNDSLMDDGPEMKKAKIEQETTPIRPIPTLPTQPFAAAPSNTATDTPSLTAPTNGSAMQSHMVELFMNYMKAQGMAPPLPATQNLLSTQSAFTAVNPVLQTAPLDNSMVTSLLHTLQSTILPSTPSTQPAPVSSPTISTSTVTPPPVSVSQTVTPFTSIPSNTQPLYTTPTTIPTSHPIVDLQHNNPVNLIFPNLSQLMLNDPSAFPQRYMQLSKLASSWERSEGGAGPSGQSANQQ